MTTGRADVVVIGLGAVGSATLRALARQGIDVIGIDRFHPPHDRGSTHGETRITRMAVGEGDAYVPLVRRTHEIWRELEAETGEQFLLQCGGLLMAPQGLKTSYHGADDFVGATVRIAERNAIPHEVLDTAELRRRYPQFLLTGTETGYFEPSAGIVFPERAVATQLRLAAEQGARLRLNERVLSLRQEGGGVVVKTDQGTVHAGHAVLAAGAWMPELVGGTAASVARVHRQTLHWFAAEDPADYAPERCPIFMWLHGARPEDFVYGFPILPGTSGVKLGSEQWLDDIRPDEVDRTINPAETRWLYDEHVAGKLRGVTDRCVQAKTCLYTVTPDCHFMIDSAPDMDRVLLASTCSGHGFKHSAALGEVLADQVTGAGAWDVGAFSLAKYLV